MKNKKTEKILENVKLKISISNFNDEEKMEMNNMKKSILKVSAIACCMLISITGIVFATDIGNFIKNFFGSNASDGVDIAVNNGYVAEVETKKQNADGIEVSVDSLIMDDYNFAMNFTMVLDEKYNIEDFDGIIFDDLMIIDENNQIVFNTVSAYQQELKEKYELAETYGGAYSMGATKQGEKELKVSLSATGNEIPFPKSKHLTITFSKIISSKLVVVDEREQKEKTEYLGNWKFELDVPKEFYNRETTIYKAINCTEKGINLSAITATLSNTAFKLYIPEIITDNIDYELLHTSTPKSIFDKIALQKEYVETSKGMRFEPSGMSDGDGGYSLPAGENKIINYRQTFNLTKFDETDMIKVHMFTNKGTEIIIELEKSK